ncbi:MAG: hypothetical protein IT384_31980 [Deltaproteobacteria bacterium]|nr:hypothetical protein [Deltaproteobacteria bacterium]
MSRAPLLVFLFAWLAPEVALACPVCGTAPESSRLAYLTMTWVMTFVPLLIFGTLIVLFVRRVRASERSEREAAAAEGEATPEPRSLQGASLPR